jgi:hypothetical protein
MVNTGQTLNLNTMQIHLPPDRVGKHEDAVVARHPPVTPPVAACHDPSRLVKEYRAHENKNRDVVEQATRSKCLSRRTTQAYL